MRYAQTIKEFVVGEFMPDVPAAELDAELDLLENGVIDSLGLLKLIAWIEDRYGIDTDQGDLRPESFRSVAAIDAFISHASPQRTEIG
ncbi:acyl carrier protein [Streptomyces afghaniensis]|uniref:acyl carrier protein n=1 Tax=Streptomyces afghaniensis TaxID=66865 RepID=UPI002780FFE8|nr:phosphopantetheine-binding protein [Streptomyces afghaniensis]MDQ1016532.1 acyl carrier protein [Streptomyces afghaniensis]